MSRTAATPEVRCAVATQDGAGVPSLPYIQSAPTSWSTASTPITTESTTFMSMTVWKPNVVVPASVGSCTLPKTPTSSATTAPAANPVRGTVMLLGDVLTAIASGCS